MDRKWNMTRYILRNTKMQLMSKRNKQVYCWLIIHEMIRIFLSFAIRKHYNFESIARNKRYQKNFSVKKKSWPSSVNTDALSTRISLLVVLYEFNYWEGVQSSWIGLWSHNLAMLDLNPGCIVSALCIGTFIVDANPRGWLSAHRSLETCTFSSTLRCAQLIIQDTHILFCPCPKS